MSEALARGFVGLCAVGAILLAGTLIMAVRANFDRRGQPMETAPAPAMMGADPFELLTTLRAAGWCVAVHNDYSMSGVKMTFWLMTHPSGIYLKGEGFTDAEALGEIAAQARKVFAPSP